MGTVLGRWRDAVADIVDERFFPLEWVEAEIEAGRITLVENDTAVIGIQRREYPGGAVELHGMFAAGEVEGISALVDEVIAAAEGYDVAVIESRAGWARLFKAKGFEVDRIRIVKELG